MASQMILVLDFGGQYNQLIARRVRECNVYCEVKPYTTPLDELIKALNPIGIIFTGGPNSVYDPRVSPGRPEIFTAGHPHSGHLLRLPADRPQPGRQGNRRDGRHRPGVRQNRDLFQHRLQAFQGPACQGHHVDEPRRLYGKGARGLLPGGPFRRLPQRGHLRREPGLLRRAVPPRGQPHPARH